MSQPKPPPDDDLEEGEINEQPPDLKDAGWARMDNPSWSRQPGQHPHPPASTQSQSQIQVGTAEPTSGAHITTGGTPVAPLRPPSPAWPVAVSDPPPNSGPTHETKEERESSHGPNASTGYFDDRRRRGGVDLTGQGLQRSQDLQDFLARRREEDVTGRRGGDNRRRSASPDGDRKEDGRMEGGKNNDKWYREREQEKQRKS